MKSNINYLHFSKEDWQRYCRGELHKEQHRQMEDHLYLCDQCLALYTELLSEIDLFPEIENEHDFTNSIMEKIVQDISQNRSSSSRMKQSSNGYFKLTIVHYLVSVALTLILMTTGVFEKITESSMQIHHREMQQSESFTENMMDKTAYVFDWIDKTTKEADE